MANRAILIHIMEDIKEMALKVALEVYGSEATAQEIEFATRLIAELQRQGTDVSWKDAEEDARDGWISVEERLPEVALGAELHCFVTSRNRKTGKLRVTDAYWCNKPTDPEWGETTEAPDWALVDEDGDHVSVVGWADRTHHPDYSSYYESMGNQHADVIAWKPVTYPAAPAMFQDSKVKK